VPNRLLGIVLEMMIGNTIDFNMPPAAKLNLTTSR
jgi:hypothetical protein